jgi:acyl carrier protein
MSNNILQESTEIFRDVIGDSRIVLQPSTTAKDIPEWDSITHVLLIVAVEKKFGVKFTAAEIQSLQNVGELVALIERKSS